LDFAKATGTEADVGGRFGLRNTREFDIFEVQGRIREASPITRDPTTQQERISEDLFVPILFRPFDRRTIYYLEAAIEWPRFEIMQHLIRGDNMAFAAFRHTRRPTKGRIFVGREVIDARLLSSESNCLVFPFYRLLGIGRDGQTIIRTGDDVEREANLAAGVLATLTGAYGQPVSADNVFSYIYGVLNSPGYLSEFEALLHDDYPRIPFASDLDMFVEMAGLGRRILDLHLLEAQDIQGMGDLVCGFPVVGTDEVDRVAFRPSERRVYINASQYFDGVTPAMWDYQIGDYQPLKKWLEDRRGRTLDLVDQRHYMKFATAIQKVVSLSTQLDATWQVIRGSGWIRFVG
jgi:predicted helicase